ncbi:MAG: Trk system potassium transporter TrkA [Lewinellaceae bacterium]|nr:Trk system potassium transporter TrkA [Lewinellaceae bacterium]
MKIVIAGAGGIGFHLAKLLSSNNHDIVIIDTNHDVLEYASTHLDVITILGDASSMAILKDAGIQDASIFLAVTTLENVNIVAAILAKKLGVKQTIARINSMTNLQQDAKQAFMELGIDKIISPSLLASQEIIRLIKSGQATDRFDFENGKVTLIGATVHSTSEYIDKTIGQIKELKHLTYTPIAILRDQKTIIPRENTVIQKGDHIYFILYSENVEELLEHLGKESRKIKRIMFVGGNLISMETARLLENDYKVTIIEQSESGCKKLVDQLSNTLVIKGDPSNIELLKEEGLNRMDVFISVTGNNETNIISALMASNEGVYKAIALVENLDYTHISQGIGVDTIINKKVIAANYIFRFVRKGKVEAIISLPGVDGEVIEYIIDKESKLTRKPIKKIKLPQQAVIGVIIRADQIIIPTGDSILQLGDKVIILALTQAIGRVEDMFM